MICQACSTRYEGFFCPGCGRFKDEQLETTVNEIGQRIALKEPDAQVAFERSLKVVRAACDSASAEHFQKRVMAASAAPSSSAPEASPPTAHPSAGTESDELAVNVEEVTYRHKTEYDYQGRPGANSGLGVRISYNQSPHAILRTLEKTSSQFEKARQALATKKAGLQDIVLYCLTAVFLFGVYGLLLGLSDDAGRACIGTVVLGLGILLVLIMNDLRRRRKHNQELATIPGIHNKRYQVAHKLFDTIKDDVAPDRTYVGWLDLTSAKREDKEFKSGKSPSGRPIIRYRDEWLRLKTKLWDGNILRCSLFEELKTRMAYYKRGRVSGKLKRKSGNEMSRHSLRLSISYNPQRYSYTAISSSQIPNTALTVVRAEDTGGRLVFEAEGGQLNESDILVAMHYAYQHLELKV